MARERARIRANPRRVERHDLAAAFAGAGAEIEQAIAAA